MNTQKHYLAFFITLGGITGTALADHLPPQAIPPVAPQKRPESGSQSTGIVLDYSESRTSTDNAAGQNHQKINPKTQKEIYAMLADEVKNIDNVVIIEHNNLADNTRPNVSKSQLTVAEEPDGHFRVFARIAPYLNDGNAILHLQLLRAGHRGDANDMVKPLSETTLKISPQNVRASQRAVHKFLAGKLHMGNGHAQEAMSRPKIAMWIEVKNADGSQEIRNGSKLVIYYKPDNNVYMNLYYINSNNEIQRLIPGNRACDNFSKAGQIYRFPPKGEGFTVTGTGTDKVRAIYTRIPSGIGADLGLKGNIRARETPIGVIPTQYPAIFANSDLSRFFSLPEPVWNEHEISYTIGK